MHPSLEIIIIKLIVAGDLRRFESLVRYQRSFQYPEGGTAQRGIRDRIPGNAEFRIELGLILILLTAAVQKVATCTQGEGHIFQQVKIRIQIKVGMIAPVFLFYSN